MGFVFSYGGAMIKDNKAVFASPEAIAAVEMYGQLLSQAGPVGIGNYEWYNVLDDFLQARTAMAIDSSNFATDISNPAKSRVAEAGRVCSLSACPRSRTGSLHVALAGVHQCQITQQAASFPVPVVGDKQADLAADRRGGAGDDTRVGLVQRGLQAGVRAQAAAAALSNLQNADVDRAKAILFHPQSRPILDAFMIGVNEVVSGSKSGKTQ